MQPHPLPHMGGVREGDAEMRVLDLVDMICQSSFAIRDSWILCGAHGQAIGQISVVAFQIPNGVANAF